MRNWLLLQLYGGTLFFAAIAVFVAVIAFDLSGRLDQHKRAKRIAGFLALLMFPLAILSAPPMPLSLALLTPAAALTYLLAGFGARKTLRRITGLSVAILCLITVAMELPYVIKRIDVPRPSRLFVIGDSLASGGFGEQRPWPTILEARSGLPVMNLALPSDEVTTALERQVPELPRPGGSPEIVIIELGGNDMLEGRDPKAFAAALDGILAAAGGPGRTVVMLELPLLPGRWSYGATQRRLAKKHDIVLVPKYALARVLLGDGNTSDGIHLTQKGHDALAGELLRRLGWNTGSLRPRGWKRQPSAGVFEQSKEGTRWPGLAVT